MIRKVTMYEGICDGCGRQFEDDGGNIIAWGDSADIEFLMQESGWQEINGKHYCPDCYEFDDGLDEYVPKKKGDLK